MSARVGRPGAPQLAQPGSSRSPGHGRRSPHKSPSGRPQLAPVGESQSTPELSERRVRVQPTRTRPRAGRRSTQTLDVRSPTRPAAHPLGRGSQGWSDKPKHRTPAELWHKRWEELQPDPSYDVDGDGVVSNLDYYLASQFDKDHNGKLDAAEIHELRRVLTKKGTAAFNALGAGPTIKKIAEKTHASMFGHTPRGDPVYECAFVDTTGDIRMSDLMSPATQTEGINPTSKDWHLQMKALNQQTKQLEGMSSHVVKSCVEHADTEAGQINMMDSMMGKGVHQMMGSGWKGDQEGHQDIYDAEIGGWVDKKAAPHEVRDQIMDFERDAKGKDVARSNDVIAGAYANMDTIEDSADMRMMQAGNRMMEDEKVLQRHNTPSSRSPSNGRRSKTSMVNTGEGGVQAKAGKLAKPDARSLRKLFKELDVDGSGALDSHEVSMLAAAGGKKLTKAQLMDAMLAMDKDGSGEVDYEEFEEWWQHGMVNPPKGTEVFRRITNQLETKFGNFRKVFRKFDENHDGTLSQHEFRKGLANCGIDLSDKEFVELMETLDEDDSNEIDYNEFAQSGVVGGKYFAARDPKGFSGEVTKKKMLDKRKRVERAFGQGRMDTFWDKTMADPAISVTALTWAGGSGI